MRQGGNTTALSSSIQSWQAAIDYEAFYGGVAILALSSKEDKEEIPWYLDHYAVYNPLQIARASEALKILIHHGQRLTQPIDFSGLIPRRQLSEILFEIIDSRKGLSRFSQIHLEMLEQHTTWQEFDSALAVTLVRFVPEDRNSNPSNVPLERSSRGDSNDGSTLVVAARSSMGNGNPNNSLYLVRS